MKWDGMGLMNTRAGGHSQLVPPPQGDPGEPGPPGERGETGDEVSNPSLLQPLSHLRAECKHKLICAIPLCLRGMLVPMVPLERG